jgi:hypothetical protein
VVIAVALLGLSVVAGQEFLTDRRVLGGPRLLARTAEWIGRLHWQVWMAPAAGTALAVGVLLIGLALKPRARTHFRSAGEPALWLRATDIARACTAAAHQLEGVARAHTVVARRTARVRIVANTPDTGKLADAARDAIDNVLREMEVARRVRVSVERRSS